MQHIVSRANGEATVHRFSNGMVVALEPLRHLHSASVGIWIKTGSANEAPEQAGISHLLEHLFFKGTATRSARQLVEAIEGKGGHINAFTAREYTCVYIRTLDTHVEDALVILADIVKHSQFLDLEKERNVVLEEISSAIDVPEEYAHDLFAEQLWAGHALGVPIVGHYETVSALSLDDIRAYYDAWYRPENMVFAVAGNFEPDQVLAFLEREFESLPRRTPPDGFPPPRFSGGKRVVGREIAQSHICFGFPGPPLDNARRYTFDMLSNTLGGGFTSRLFERIREDEGLAYSIYSFHSCYLASGTIGVYAAVAPENLARSMELCSEELRKMCEEPAPEAEVESNREQLKGNMLMSLESTFNRMARMAKGMLYYGRIIPLEEIIEKVDAVSAEGMQQAAQEAFQLDKCAAVILGPTDGRPAPELCL